MDIFVQPSEAGVKRLLKASQLNSSDLTPEHLRHFFGLGTIEEPEGIVGLEVFSTVALLRSLAVVSSRRGAGLGSKLLAHAEDYGRNLGITSLYLLTNTAEAFFKHRGYKVTGRDDAPLAIRQTKEFSVICPVSSTIMVKHLQTENRMYYGKKVGTSARMNDCERRPELAAKGLYDRTNAVFDE